MLRNTLYEIRNTVQKLNFDTVCLFLGDDAENSAFFLKTKQQVFKWKKVIFLSIRSNYKLFIHFNLNAI